jgi:quinoprotein glucose dehydrogenase
VKDSSEEAITMTVCHQISIISITGAIVALLGLSIGVLGGWLIALGGSSYYLIVGLAMMLCGGLISTDRASGVLMYALILVGTAIWGVWEVKLDGWALIPRLVAPSVLGLWIFSPWVAGRIGRANKGVAPGRWAWAGVVGSLALLVLVFASGYATTASRFVHESEPTGWQATKQTPPNAAVSDKDWSFYGRTPAGDRFSPLDQISPANVGKLEQAWSFSTGDLPRSGENANGRESSFEATPIKVGEKLYFCTPHREVIALDATTGRQVRRFDPRPQKPSASGSFENYPPL